MKRLTILLTMIFILESTGIDYIHPAISKRYALRPIAAAISDVKGPEVTQDHLASLTSSFSALSPFRRARLEYISFTKGIIDPKAEISQLCQRIAKETLKDFGLNPDEYIFLISDSDEIATEFYNQNNENIIEITWGLLQFLKRHNIFNIDTLRFIIGHEIGHALITEEKRKDKEKHSLLSEEYRTDGYGLKAVDRRKGSPLAGFFFLKALREEGLESSITITHPKLHRRQIKLYNEIRFHYWTNLSEDIKPLVGELLDIPRSKRFAFDDYLYNNISIEHILSSIPKANSYHDLLKLMHLLSYILKIKTALNGLKTKKTDLYIDVYPGKEYKKTDLLEFYKNPQKNFGSYLILKYIKEENINPKEYLTENDITNIRNDFSSLKLGDDEFQELLRSFLALKLEWKLHDVLWKKHMVYSLFNMFFYEDDKEGLQEFWNDEKKTYKSIKSKLEQSLKKRITEIMPEFNGLSDKDRQTLFKFFFMGPLEYLDDEHTADNDEQKKRFSGISFEDPVKVLKIFLDYSYQYKNDYLEFSGKGKSWLESLFVYDEYKLNHYDDYSSSRGIYITFFNTLAAGEVLLKVNKDEVPLNELMDLYRTYVKNRDIFIDFYDFTEGNFPGQEARFTKEIKEAILCKIKSFEQFQRLINLGKTDVGWPEALFEQLISRMEKKDILDFTEFLMREEEFRRYFYGYAENLCVQAYRKGVEPEEMIKTIDRLLAQYEREDYWPEKQYKLLAESLARMYIGRVKSLIKGYAYLIDKLPDNERKKELIAHYYKKFDHNFWVYLPSHVVTEQPQPKNLHIADSQTSYILVPILLDVLRKEGLTPYKQMKYLIEQGYLSNCELMEEITDLKERKDLFALLKDKDTKERFSENRIDEEAYREYVSFVAWLWFLDNPTMDKMQKNTKLSEIEWLMPYLECSRVNVYMFDCLEHWLNWEKMDDADIEVFRRMVRLCKAEETSIPSSLMKLNEVRFHDFCGEKGYYDRQYRGEKDSYYPLYISMGELPEVYYDRTDYFYLMLGDRLLKHTLKKINKGLNDPSWPLKEKIEVIYRCFPYKTLYRNTLLFKLVGNPFFADPYQLDEIYDYLADDHVKNAIARRIILQKRKDKRLNLTSYQEVRNLIEHYFPKDTPIRQEMFHLLLQDVPISIPELNGLKLKDPFETVGEEIERIAFHEIIEHIADTLEDKPTPAKREFFEWLIGVRKRRPAIVRWYEYIFRRNLDDLPKLIASLSKVERYAFLSSLLVGAVKKEGVIRIRRPDELVKGVLNDDKEKNTLLMNVFKSLTGKETKEIKKDIFFIIFNEFFKICPEFKQLDILYALFEYCAENGAPNPLNRNEIIIRVLMAYGVVGVKLGQALARLKLIKDEELKKALLACNDDVYPLDKRFALNAMLYDNDIDKIEAVIETIDELLGSASIKQGYKVTKKDKRKRALKYIKPLASYEVRENLSVLKQTIQRLKKKIPILKLVSDTLYREVEGSVLDEFKIEIEKENQQYIGAFSDKMKGFGWELEIMKIDRELEGKNFMMDEFFEGGVPLDEALKQNLINKRDFKNISSLITVMVIRQILILGRYHADLHYGNILINPAKRRICIIDFGNCGRLSYGGRELFCRFISCILFRRFISGKRIEHLIIKMTEKPLKELPEDASRAIDEVLKRHLDIPGLCRQIKEVLEHNKISFTGEFEFLFKFLESVRYLTDNIGLKGKVNAAQVAYRFLKEKGTNQAGANISVHSGNLTQSLRYEKEIILGVQASS